MKNRHYISMFFGLMLPVGLAAQDWTPPTVTGQELELNDTVYAFNVQANLFLNGNGTRQTCVAGEGIALYITQNADGTYMLGTPTDTTDAGAMKYVYYEDFQRSFIGGNPDNAHLNWSIEAQGDGIYYIRPNKDDPDYGSYFLYGTSSSTGFFCWKSADLIHWDAVGYALMYNDQESLQGKALWQDTWASEVVFDSEAGKWYMYFSATPRDLSVTDGYAASKEYVCIPYIAESDSPRGPFELIDHVETYRTLDGTPLKDVAGRDESAEYFFQRYMTFDPYEMEQALQKLGLSENAEAEEEEEA